MKLWRKSLSVATVVCLSLSMILTGCGNGTKPVSGDTAKPEVKIEYAKGVMTETSFESEYIGVKFALPENYIMATEEEVQSMVDFGGEIAYSDVEKKIIDYSLANTVYEMMAFDSLGMPNVSVMVEKLKLENMTVEQYQDALKTQLAAVPDMGYTFESEPTTMIIGGQEYTVLPASVDMQGVKLLQDYCLRKVDERMIGFIVTYSEDTKEKKDVLMSAFVPYN